MFDKTKAAKEWCQSPVEKYIDEDGNSQDKQMQTPVDGVLWMMPLPSERGMPSYAVGPLSTCLSKTNQ